jgi:hypothetical protein
LYIKALRTTRRRKESGGEGRARRTTFMGGGDRKIADFNDTHVLQAGVKVKRREVKKLKGWAVDFVHSGGKKILYRVCHEL